MISAAAGTSVPTTLDIAMPAGQTAYSSVATTAVGHGQKRRTHTVQARHRHRVGWVEIRRAAR